jgi:hypothetical protein
MEFKWCGLSDVTEKGEWGLLHVVYLGLGPDGVGILWLQSLYVSCNPQAANEIVR